MGRTAYLIRSGIGSRRGRAIRMSQRAAAPPAGSSARGDAGAEGFEPDLRFCVRLYLEAAKGIPRNAERPLASVRALPVATSGPRRCLEAVWMIVFTISNRLT